MNWRGWLFAVALLASQGAASSAFAHGFKIFLLDNKIRAESEDFTNMDERLYNGNFGFDMFDFSGALKLIGGGINIPGDTFTMEIFSPVWYSDGNQAVAIGPGLTMTVDSYANYIEPNHITLLDSASWTATSTGSSTLPLPGHNSDTMIWSMSGNFIPDGVYGMGVVIHGLDEGSPLTPFISSDRLVITFRTPGFGSTSSATLHAARLAVFEAAMAAAVVPTGDFDMDGDVDGADFIIWQTNYPIFGDAEQTSGDANSDGNVDGIDFAIWQDQFPQSPSPGAAPVPEPSGIMIGFAAAASLAAIRRVSGKRIAR
jgi:hypothetical protein